jgi:hypothetical protein
MTPTTSPNRVQPTHAAPRTLTLRKETLRRLTPDRLRLAAGGAGRAICTLHDSGCTDQPSR